MNKDERALRPAKPRTKFDPPAQPQTGVGEDVTSGSEGGGPRIGYSEADEADSDRHRFPRPSKPK
jgi:hypothetical protein